MPSPAPTTCPTCGSALTKHVSEPTTRDEYEATRKEERPRWEYECGAVIGGGGWDFFELEECGGKPRPPIREALKRLNDANAELRKRTETKVGPMEVAGIGIIGMLLFTCAASTIIGIGLGYGIGVRETEARWSSAVGRAEWDRKYGPNRVTQ